MDIITEESAKLKISSEKKISKKLEVFYNPVMKLNRDISVLLLNSVEDVNMQIADPLAGSGVRGIRFLKELKKNKILNISFNDYKTSGYIKENLKLNKLDKTKDVFVFDKDANLFLLESTGFDYIDVDPFGSPNPFLESAVVRLSRKGILAVTATDTSALAGSSPSACFRKYWAKPLKNELMHEIGIRILIRKIQLIGAEYEKALFPIFSYAKEHYYRIFFRCEKGKQKVDSLLKDHKFFIYNEKTLERKTVDNIFNKEKGFDYAGPIWAGRLWDEHLAKKMYENFDKKNKELSVFLSIIKDESKIDSVGFFDLPKLAKSLGKKTPKVESVLKEGKITRTHFLGWGVRTNISPLKKIIS